VVTRIINNSPKDTIIKINQDASLIDMLFECDSLRQMQIKDVLAVTPGKNVRPASVKVNGDTLKVSCYVDSFSVYMQYKERFEKTDSTIHEEHDSTISKTVTTTVDCITSFENFEIWAGRIALILLVLAAIFMILKTFYKF